MVVEEEFLTWAVVELDDHRGIAMPIGHEAERTEAVGAAIPVQDNARPPVRRLGIDALWHIGQRPVGKARRIGVSDIP